MSPFYVDEHPLTDPSPSPVAFPDGSTHESSDPPPDIAYGCYKSPLQPQIATRADEVQTDRHALWASATLDSEVTPPYVSGPSEILHSLALEPVGCLPDRPEVQTQNRASFHFPEHPFESRSGRSSLPSVHFLNDGGGFLPSFNLLQQPVSSITRTLLVPLHLPTQP
jgi:hypothetical protein